MSTSLPADALAPLLALFEPLIKTIVADTVAETLAQREPDESRLSDRLWVAESEAASSLLGVPAHRLRDCRRRGEIVGSKVGKTIGYERAELLRFIRSQRLEP